MVANKPSDKPIYKGKTQSPNAFSPKVWALIVGIITFYGKWQN